MRSTKSGVIRSYESKKLDTQSIHRNLSSSSWNTEKETRTPPKFYTRIPDEMVRPRPAFRRQQSKLEARFFETESYILQRIVTARTDLFTKLSIAIEHGTTSDGSIRAPGMFMTPVVRPLIWDERCSLSETDEIKAENYTVKEALIRGKDERPHNVANAVSIRPRFPSGTNPFSHLRITLSDVNLLFTATSAANQQWPQPFSTGIEFN